MLAKNFWSSLNFHFNEAVSFVLQKFTTLVDSEGREGQLGYSDGGVYVHNGTEWVPVGGGQTSDTMTFDFTAEASDAWTINHNLGRYVVVQTMDLQGNRIEGTVNWSSDMNSITVTFTEPMQGTAIIGYGLGSQSERVFTFDTSDTWTIKHDLGRYVLVQTMTSDGVRVEGEVVWDPDDLNTVTVTFTEPISGTALII